MTAGVTIAVALVWLVGKEVLRPRVYQRFGVAREPWAPAARRLRIGLVILAILNGAEEVDFRFLGVAPAAGRPTACARRGPGGAALSGHAGVPRRILRPPEYYRNSFNCQPCHPALPVLRLRGEQRHGEDRTMASKNPAALARAWSWLSLLPYDNPIERRQATLVQTLLLAVLLLSASGAFIALLAPIPRRDALAVMAIVWLGVPLGLVGIRLLHRGRLSGATLLTCVGLILLLSFLLVTTGSRDGGALLFGFALPIVLAGLLASWRTMALSIGLSGAGILLAMTLERLRVPLVGIAAPRGENTAGVLGGFLVIAAILGVFVLRFGQALRTALSDAERRAHQLEQIQASLETTVAARTAELRAVLDEVQLRAEAQARLLDENVAQRSTIQSLSVPVLPVSTTTLVVPLVGALDSARLQMLQERTLRAVERSTARRILLDVSAVPLLDSQVARILLDVVRQVRLLGAEAALVGIRPEVAQALVALGVELDAVRTYRDLEAALHAER